MKNSTEKSKLTLVGGNRNIDESERARGLECEELLFTHVCRKSDTPHPQWCISTEATNGGREVRYWIRSEEGDEWVARRIAKYLNDSGAKARVEMTEWNEAPEILPQESNG